MKTARTINRVSILTKEEITFVNLIPTYAVPTYIDNNNAPRIEGEDDERRDPRRELMTRQYRMFKEGVISDSSEDTVANNHVGTIDLSLSSVEEEEGNLFSEQKVNQLKKDPRIIGGTNAGSSEFPFSVSMQDNIGHFCGGSLITPNMVLTAA